MRIIKTSRYDEEITRFDIFGAGKEQREQTVRKAIQEGKLIPLINQLIKDDNLAKLGWTGPNIIPLTEEIVASGQIPEKWIDHIVKEHQYYGTDSFHPLGRFGKDNHSCPFAGSWINVLMRPGNIPPKKILDIIYDDIQAMGRPPRWAAEWAKNILDSGQAPKELIESIHHRIRKSNNIGDFAKDWYKKQQEQVQPEQMGPWAQQDKINRMIQESGSAPAYAQEWAKQKLDSGQAPPEWIKGILSRLQKSDGGRFATSNFSVDWLKQQLESGPFSSQIAKIIEQIAKRTNYAFQPNEIPDFAVDWAKQLLHSGQPPTWLADHLGSCLQGKHKRIPRYAEEFVTIVDAPDDSPFHSKVFRFQNPITIQGQTYE